MNSEVRLYRGGADDPFRGEVDRAAAMRSWLAAVQREPERRVRASTVMLQGLIGAHRDQRQIVLDQIWNDLIAIEIDQELAERLEGANAQGETAGDASVEAVARLRPALDAIVRRCMIADVSARPTFEQVVAELDSASTS